jgi:hypothetical protein
LKLALGSAHQHGHGGSRILGLNHPAAGAFLGMSEKPKFHSKMIKDGRWTVAVNTGHGPVSHVGNFATEEEANRWIVEKLVPTDKQ